jgi:type I restriction enzyme S subunit
MPLRMNVRQLPEGWVEKKLGDVCEKVEYGSSAKSKPEGKMPVIRMGNIQNGSIDWSDLVYTTDQEEIDKYLLKYNDVLFNRTNSDEHVGKTAIYKGEIPAIFAGYLIRIHRKEDLLDADFLNYYLNSPTTREYGKSVMSRSVNQANINGTKLKDYPIIVPPLPEQKQIVAILDEAFEGIDRAIANTEKNLANSRELFESYLNAIFSQKGDGWVEKKLGNLLDTLTDYHANGSYEILKQNVSLLDIAILIDL